MSDALFIKNNVDITCTVAPGILFYNVYECDGDAEEEDAAMDVDTSAAGANLVLADGSKNKVYGSYVAKIFESCELSEDGTEVVDSKKLYKFDGAVFSKRSLNIFGDTGSLDIVAENEGLCSDMHMTIHGGTINIKSGNDGINTSEDNISLFNMLNGKLNIQVTGETGEGDGIDSNGWLLINGGTVVASGNMNAEISEGEQASVSFMSRESLEGGKTYEVKDADGNVIIEVSPTNKFTMLAVSEENMTAEGIYTLWLNNTQVAEGMQDAARGSGMGGGMRPDGGMPEGMEPSEGQEPAEKPEEQSQ